MNRAEIFTTLATILFEDTPIPGELIMESTPLSGWFDEIGYLVLYNRIEDLFNVKTHSYEGPRETIGDLVTMIEVLLKKHSPV